MITTPEIVLATEDELEESRTSTACWNAGIELGHDPDYPEVLQFVVRHHRGINHPIDVVVPRFQTAA